MDDVSINDSNATVVLDTYSLFIQAFLMLPFVQASPLIITSRFLVINMINSIARLHYLLVILFKSIGLNHVLPFICLTYANEQFNVLSSNFLITFVKLYV